MPQSPLEVLRSVPILSNVPESDLVALAQASRERSYPAGQVILRQDAPGDAMYVVVDGELVASLQRNGRRTELSRMRRGDTAGEVALFHGTRTADVDVETDARLLRFDQADLDRLARRYPRIAAKVYRNLNRIIAQRIANTSQALR